MKWFIRSTAMQNCNHTLNEFQKLVEHISSRKKPHALFTFHELKNVQRGYLKNCTTDYNIPIWRFLSNLAKLIGPKQICKQHLMKQRLELCQKILIFPNYCGKTTKIWFYSPIR